MWREEIALNRHRVFAVFVVLQQVLVQFLQPIVRHARENVVRQVIVLAHAERRRSRISGSTKNMRVLVSQPRSPLPCCTSCRRIMKNENDVKNGSTHSRQIIQRPPYGRSAV